MIYGELYAWIAALPKATDGWLRRTISFVDRGQPHSTSYCLVRRAEGIQKAHIDTIGAVPNSSRPRPSARA